KPVGDQEINAAEHEEEHKRVGCRDPGLGEDNALAGKDEGCREARDFAVEEPAGEQVDEQHGAHSREGTEEAPSVRVLETTYARYQRWGNVIGHFEDFHGPRHELLGERWVRVLVAVELPSGGVVPVYLLGGAREVSLVEVKLARGTKPDEARKERSDQDAHQQKLIDADVD